jgi:hypothetical protein
MTAFAVNGTEIPTTFDRVVIRERAYEVHYPATMSGVPTTTLAAGTLVTIYPTVGVDVDADGKPTLNVCKADADFLKLADMGVMLDAIEPGGYGIAAKMARIGGLNTAAGAIGDPVYLSASAGAWTLTMPTAGIVQIVGYVVNVGTTDGEILFTPDLQQFVNFLTMTMNTFYLGDNGEGGVAGHFVIRDGNDASVSLDYDDLKVLYNVTAGTAAASKALVAGASIELQGLLLLGLGTSGVGGSAGVLNVTDGGSNVVEIVYGDLLKIDGITAGTVAASKALVVDANKDIASLRNVTAATLKLTALPTSDPTVAGALWNDGGTVKVSAGS